VNPLAALRSRLLFTLEADVGPPVDIGDVGAGSRRCIPLLRGRFFGELEGDMVPGGADWQTVRSDDALEISAHYALRTRSGETIEVLSNGVRTAPSSVLARLSRQEPVTPDEYYFRTHIRFRTAAPGLWHLNTALAVSVGERLPAAVRLAVFEVL
jgi:hypothetical protein